MLIFYLNDLLSSDNLKTNYSLSFIKFNDHIYNQKNILLIKKSGVK